MATYILFWNPAISSYTMERFQNDFVNEDFVSNWSINEYERLRHGDTFYLVRCGDGRTGIVASGIFDSNCYISDDWSPKRRVPIFYADLDAWTVVNPESDIELLTPEKLTEAISDFNWFGGHSGRRLTDEQAKKLDELWINYIDRNPKMFAEEKAFFTWRGNDNLHNNENYKAYLCKKNPEERCEICGYDYKNYFGKDYSDKKVTFSELPSLILPRLMYRICENCNRVDNALLIKVLSGRK